MFHSHIEKFKIQKSHYKSRHVRLSKICLLQHVDNFHKIPKNNINDRLTKKKKYNKNSRENCRMEILKLEMIIESMW